MSDSTWSPDAVPPSGTWTGPGPAPILPPVRHTYPLLERNHGLATAISLVMRSLPYAFARFGVERCADVHAEAYAAALEHASAR